MKKNLFIVFLAVLCVVLVQSSVWAEEKAADYLKEYFDIAFEGEVTAEAYNNALTVMGADELETDTLTLADAIVGAVRLANMEELAMVYKDVLGKSKTEVELPVDAAYTPYLYFAVMQDWVDDDLDPRIAQGRIFKDRDPAHEGLKFLQDVIVGKAADIVTAFSAEFRRMVQQNRGIIRADRDGR